MTTSRTFFACLFQALAFIPAVAADGGARVVLAPEWRITQAARAPWAPAESPRPTLQDWIGRTLTFHADSVDGPGALHCDHAVMEPTLDAADVLFQGNLPSPAGAAAQALGIARLPLAGVSLRCDSGVFEFHGVDAETLLLGYDNQVLTLSRTAGTLATADSPEGRTQRFLEAHFGGDMGFTPASAGARHAWFSRALEDAMAVYFARPSSADEVPVIDGDPFTDSQEYPRRFAVGQARVSGETAEVPVRFSDAFSERTITYLLRYKGGAWQLEDLRYPGGGTLADLLK